MPRIFKFSKFALKLFVPHASELTDMKIYIYTDNFDIAYVVTSGFKINVNEVGIVIPQNAVNNMSDGIINYRIEGYLNGEFYMEQRQSNYFLKTPSFEIEDTNIIAISTEFVDEGNYKMIIKASEYNVDGLSQVEIDATTFAEEKYEEGNVAGIEIGKEVQKAKLTGITITENGIYSREDGYNEIHVEVPDLNGDYQTGYDAGYVDGEYRGFNNGYTAGETDQKDKLESISITENGTYTREDGYNEVIVNVEGGSGDCSDIENAKEITITENGVYTTKYTDIVTGDDNFKSCATLINSVYDTGIKPNSNTKVELWWNNITATQDNFECFIFGTQDPAWKLMWTQELPSNFFVAEINNRWFSFEFPYKGWHHIIMSYEDGIIMNGKKIDTGDFMSNLENEIEQTIYINGNPSSPHNFINGQYGMIKITKDGETTTIIPTAEGFLNTNTGEYLTQVEDGQYVFIEEIDYDKGDLFKTVIVNVPDFNGDWSTGFEEGRNMGYDEGLIEGENNIKNNITQITINKNGVYDLTPKKYLYMDDDRFKLFEGGYVGNCCKIVFKVLSPGADIIYGGQYKIYMEDMSHITVAWGVCGGTFEIEENEWNTIEIFGYNVVINGVFHEMEVISEISNKSMLYLGDTNYNGGVFMFNEFSFWETQDAFLSNETPDYIVSPSLNCVRIDEKNGHWFNSPNLNNGASAYPEIDQPSEYGWNKVDVMVKPKLPNGVKFANASILGDFPDDYDFSEVKNFSQMFSTITGMTSIPMIDTSNATTMASMFEYCRFLKEVPLMSTENVTNMYRMFKECDKLENIPHFNTSKCKEFDEMFYGCESLKTIPQLDTSNATSLVDTFYGCTNITTLPALDCTSLINGNYISSGLDNLVEFGGWLNLKEGSKIDNLKYLSYNSCRNIINGLATVSASDKQYLYVSQEFLDTAGYSLIAQAERKNWVVKKY